MDRSQIQMIEITEHEFDEWRERVARLRAAANAAFFAMVDQRDNPDEEVFQDAIDALGVALSAE